MMDNYMDFCMSQVVFWETKLAEYMKAEKQDDLISEIDDILRLRSVPKLKDLYKKLEELRNNKDITEEQYKQYLKYISTSKVVA